MAVTLRVRDPNDTFVADEVARQAQGALFRYLSPICGGPDGNGWPIGRDLHVSELYARLQRIRGVEYVEDVRVTTPDPDAPGTMRDVAPRLSIASDAVLFSGQHNVEIA